MVKQEKIHLILLDIIMPEMDSLTAMAKIREISNVPIILLTAKSEDMDKILGLDCGAWGIPNTRLFLSAWRQ